MKKKGIISLVAAAALVAGTMASVPAFAGATINASNTSLAQEAISSSNGTSVKVNVAFDPGTTLPSGSKITFTLSGAAFDNETYDNVTLYDNNGPVASGLISADNKTNDVTLTTTQTISAGGYTLSDNASAAAPSSLAIKVPAGAQTGDTVTMAASGAVVSPSATVVTVQKEFSASVKAATSKISFADSLKDFVGGSDNSTATLFINEDATIATKVITGAELTCFDNSSSISNIKVTGKLTSVKSAVYGSNTPYYLTDTDRTNGYFTLNNTHTYICPTSVVNPGTKLTLYVDTKTVISPDTKTIQVNLTGLPAGTETIIPAGTTAFNWQLNATQFYVPLVGYNADTGRQTYIKLQANNSDVTDKIDVSAQVLTDNGKMTDVGVVGSITPGTPLVIQGDTLIKDVEAAGYKVDGTQGFAVVLTVKAPRKDVFGYVNIVDPSGAKRVPLQCVYDGAASSTSPHIVE